VTFDLRREESILIVTPGGPLEASDFERLALEVDPCIAEKGRLAGLMIRAAAVEALSLSGQRGGAGVAAKHEVGCAS
jgi:hypothetical protein